MVTFLFWASLTAVTVAVTGGDASDIRYSLGVYGFSIVICTATHAGINWYRRRLTPESA